MTPNPNPSPDLREAIARIVYGAMQWAASNREVSVPPSWVHNGNSFAQCEARAKADAILAALSPQTLPAPGEVETLRKALSWYEQMVGDCRKITPVGDAARVCLDKDGGKLATEAFATVAAANDEGVALHDVIRKWRHEFAPNATGAQHDALFAAIRLLSQGVGK